VEKSARIVAQSKCKHNIEPKREEGFTTKNTKRQKAQSKEEKVPFVSFVLLWLLW
jgi:hypothetical protein